MNTPAVLTAVQRKAQSRSDGEDDYARLAEICEHAMSLEGSIQRFGARAAIAEMAELWIDQLNETNRADALLEHDIRHMIEELDQFLDRVLGSTNDFEDPTARKVLVACRDANGVSCLYPAVVYATDGEVEEGYHYKAAERQARADGYELPSGARVCIDEQDADFAGQTSLFDAVAGWDD